VVQLSIDGPTAQIHDFLRGTGSFERVTQAARHLTAAKERLGKPRPVVVVNTVLNAKNYDRLADMVRLAHSLGASALWVNPMRIYVENRPWVQKAKLRLSDKQKEQLSEIWKKTEQIAASVRLKFGPPLSEKIDEVARIVKFGRPTHKKAHRFLTATCFAPFYSLIVNAMGNVGQCASAPTTPSGDNVRVKSLAEIWYGERFRSVRACVLAGRFPFDRKCRACGMILVRRVISAHLSTFLLDKSSHPNLG
jgi:MoaA/NifB/PqqE/SkfB family radical SAM enzyme